MINSDHKHQDQRQSQRQSQIETIDQVDNYQLKVVFRNFVIAGFAATLITLTLLWTMDYLISSKQNALLDDSGNGLLSFIRVKQIDTELRKENRPTKPPPPKQPPAEPPPPALDRFATNQQKIEINMMPVQMDINLQGGFNLAPVEGDYLPIVKVAPMYPRRAQSKNLEGYCTVQYTVTRTGTTKDVKVINSECSNYLFKSSSIKAALKFKYKPRIENGEAVEVTGVRNMFNFKIDGK